MWGMGGIICYEDHGIHCSSHLLWPLYPYYHRSVVILDAMRVIDLGEVLCTYYDPQYNLLYLIAACEQDAYCIANTFDRGYIGSICIAGIREGFESVYGSRRLMEKSCIPEMRHSF
ncbi:hypothetical protein Nepgr_004229 [Nepenthes gracilis]|uniref:Uncharacterized protein n=1 Tax=Nepenthes gracilis TaxID=150966 RepID=A0AAD3S0Y6_NEPGR|nr:hypothetical protein Nepgr_004229 [Nepenthes gracilis]